MAQPNEEYMLMTTSPLYRQKSFHKSMDEVIQHINIIMEITDECYDMMGKEFIYERDQISMEFPGILVFKLWPGNPIAFKLYGDEKGLKSLENEGFDV